MANNKVQLADGTVLIDITDTTAVASDVAAGKYFYGADGIKTLGTGSGGGNTIIFNGGLVSQSDDDEGNVDLVFAPAGEAYTLIDSRELTVNTTSTSQVSKATINIPQIYHDSDVILYTRIIDKAGPRDGYFYGSHNWIVQMDAKNGTSGISSVARYIYKYSGTQYSCYTSAYGIYVYGTANSSSLYQVKIYSRYNSTYSTTINGTYLIDTYALTPPSGKHMFD